jgi:hypothetical protein
MPRHNCVEIRIVWMPHNDMPSPLNDLKPICTMQVPKVVLPLSRGRLLHACEQVPTSSHRACLAHTQEEIPSCKRRCRGWRLYPFV